MCCGRGGGTGMYMVEVVLCVCKCVCCENVNMCSVHIIVCGVLCCDVVVCALHCAQWYVCCGVLWWYAMHQCMRIREIKFVGDLFEFSAVSYPAFMSRLSGDSLHCIKI